jgi:type II secretory pathway component PulM
LSRNTAIEPVSNAAKATWIARHQAMNARVQQGDVDLVYVGDSIVSAMRHRGKAPGTATTLPVMR